MRDEPHRFGCSLSDEQTVERIGVKLRQMFDQVVNEPVPDEFLDILRRADAPKAGSEGERG